MLNHYVGIVCAIMLLSTSCKDQGPKDDVADIRNTFNNYVQALTQGEGKTAAALVDSNTLSYYDRMLEMARAADSVEVSRADLMDKITVLGLRMHASGSGLTKMSAKDAIAAGAANGMLGGEQLKALDIGNISVDGDEASAPMKLGGFPVPAKFHFRREGEQWKIDITPLFTISRMAFEQMGARRGEAGDEWLMELLTSSTGQRPSNDIWHPQQ